MVTARTLSFTTLIAATMGACAVSLAEEVKDSSTTEIVSAKDSDLQNEDALRVAVGDFDDVEFLLSAEDMEAIADNVYISFNGVSAKGGEGSGSSISSAEASGQVETTESSSTTFSGALTLASATSETVTTSVSSVAMSLSSDNSTEQYATVDAGKSYYEQVSTSNSGSAVTTYSATSFLGNSNSVGDGDGSYGTSTLSNGGDIKPLKDYPYTWTGDGDGTNWSSGGGNDNNWSDSYGWENSAKDNYNVTFDATGSEHPYVTVNEEIIAASLTVTGNTAYTFEYAENASLTATGNVVIGNSSGSGSLTITGGPNTFTGAIYVGNQGTGLLTITDGTNTFGADNTYIYIGDSATGTFKITGGNNKFSAGTISLGYNSDDEGTIEITGGTVEFAPSTGATGVLANMYVGMNGTGEIIIGTLGDTGDGPTVTFTTGTSKGTELYLGYYTGSTGKITINSGTTTFEESVNLYVGGHNSNSSKCTGTIEINGGTTIFDTVVYLGHANSSTGTLSINGGNNTFYKDVYVGYTDSSKGSLEISNGTNTFGTVYVGRNNNGDKATGTMTVTGGYTTVETLSVSNGQTTSVSGGTLVVDNLVQNDSSSLNISGNGAVEITTSTSGTGASGIYASGSGKLIIDVAVTAGEGGNGSDLTIEFKDNSTLVIQGGLLQAIVEADGEYVDVLQAGTISFGEYVIQYTGQIPDPLDDGSINKYVYAGGYTLTWQYDSSTHILSAAIAPIPEPGMFSLFAGLGAIGLVATRRRRRKVA